MGILKHSTKSSVKKLERSKGGPVFATLFAKTFSVFVTCSLSVFRASTAPAVSTGREQGNRTAERFVSPSKFLPGGRRDACDRAVDAKH